jgi:hypothetical protein
MSGPLDRVILQKLKADWLCGIAATAAGPGSCAALGRPRPAQFWRRCLFHPVRPLAASTSRSRMNPV